MGLGIRLRRFNRKWRKNNKHNSTCAENIFNIDNVKVGNFTYGPLYVLCYNPQNKLQIGNLCSIAPGVKFIVAADHLLSNLSTFPFKVKCMGEKYEAVSKGDIIVDDDVWIGCNAIILSGVHIGQGAVVAAGAVVNSNVPPYAVVGGVPAKLIKYRFNEEIIEKLMKIDYSRFDSCMINNNIEQLYRAIDENYSFDWLPHK